jgi:hypothetical protein
MVIVSSSIVAPHRDARATPELWLFHHCVVASGLLTFDRLSSLIDSPGSDPMAG